MNDDGAKRSTDNDSGQNMASKEDLHRTLLHASNPAFHTIRRLGLEGLIKPEKKKKVEKTRLQRTVREETVDKSNTGSDVSNFSQWLSTLSKPTVVAQSGGGVGTETKGADDLKETKERKATSISHGKDSLDIIEPEYEPKPVKGKGLKGSEKRKKKEKKKHKKRQVPDSGVILSDDIFSETLADLLASQGHRKQAIVMYEKMCLIYPEKSRFFAAKIETLNKKE